MGDIFKQAQETKNRKYKEPIAKYENRSFIPVIMSTGGAIAVEANKVLKKLIALRAQKKKTNKQEEANMIRVKLAFILLRSRLMCIRGERKKRNNAYMSQQRNP